MCVCEGSTYEQNVYLTADWMCVCVCVFGADEKSDWSGSIRKKKKKKKKKKERW